MNWKAENVILNYLEALKIFGKDLLYATAYFLFKHTSYNKQNSFQLLS